MAARKVALTPGICGPFYIEFGYRVRERRLALGLSQRALCRAAGLSAGTGYLSFVEAGRARATLHFASALAGALGCALTDLFDPTLDSAPRNKNRKRRKK